MSICSGRSRRIRELYTRQRHNGKSNVNIGYRTIGTMHVHVDLHILSL